MPPVDPSGPAGGLAARAPRFAGVGAAGFAIDAGLFFGLSAAGVAPIAAKVAATAVAILVTWALNRAVTFRTAGTARPLPELARYVGASAVGALSNLAVFVLLSPFDAALAHAPAYAAGAAAGLVANFVLCDRIVFRRAGGLGR